MNVRGGSFSASIPQRWDHIYEYEDRILSSALIPLRNAEVSSQPGFLDVSFLNDEFPSSVLYFLIMNAPHPYNPVNI